MMLAIWLEDDMAIGELEDEGELEAARACKSAWYGMPMAVGEEAAEEAIEE